MCLRGDLPKGTFEAFLGASSWYTRLGDEASVNVDISRPIYEGIFRAILHFGLNRVKSLMIPIWTCNELTFRCALRSTFGTTSQENDASNESSAMVTLCARASLGTLIKPGMSYVALRPPKFDTGIVACVIILGGEGAETMIGRGVRERDRDRDRLLRLRGE